MKIIAARGDDKYDRVWVVEISHSELGKILSRPQLPIALNKMIGAEFDLGAIAVITETLEWYRKRVKDMMDLSERLTEHIQALYTTAEAVLAGPTPPTPPPDPPPLDLQRFDHIESLPEEGKAKKGESP